MMDEDRFYSSIAEYYEYIFPLNEQQVGFVVSEVDLANEFYFLDAGCATGQLANALSKRGALGIGIDLNDEMISRAVAMYTSASLSFRNLDMLRIADSFPEGWFDTVICFGNTLVHLDSIVQVRDFLKQSALVLKPDGKLLLQLLNYDYILDRQLTELPLIENDHIRFVREYVLPGTGHAKMTFKTSLTIKETGESLQNRVKLLPIRQKELEKLLYLVGFKQVSFYADFARSPALGDHLPLVVVAER